MGIEKNGKEEIDYSKLSDEARALKTKVTYEAGQALLKMEKEFDSITLNPSKDAASAFSNKLFKFVLDNSYLNLYMSENDLKEFKDCICDLRLRSLNLITEVS